MGQDYWIILKAVLDFIESYSSIIDLFKILGRGRSFSSDGYIKLFTKWIKIMFAYLKYYKDNIIEWEKVFMF